MVPKNLKKKWWYGIMAMCLCTYTVSWSLDQEHSSLQEFEAVKKTIDELSAKIDALQKEKITDVGRKPAIKGFLQFLLSVYEDDNTAGLDQKNNFSFKRARIIIDGKCNDSLAYAVNLEMKDTTQKYLLDAKCLFKINTYIDLTAGQFKAPFGREYRISSSRLSVIELSQLSGSLVPQYDIGVMAGKQVWDTTRFNLTYAAGIFNGSGKNTDDGNDDKDFIGRLLWNPAGIIGIGVSYQSGRQPLHIFRERKGADMLLAIEKLKLTGEYAHQSEHSKTAATVNKEGWMCMGTYRFNFGLEPVVMYDQLDADISTHANNINKITTAGLNYYWSDDIKLQVHYRWINETGAASPVDNNQVLALMQVGF